MSVQPLIMYRFTEFEWVTAKENEWIDNRIWCFGKMEAKISVLDQKLNMRIFLKIFCQIESHNIRIWVRFAILSENISH